MSTQAARLRKLGLTYREYLRSEHWRNTRASYRASGLPQACLVCGASKVNLHHRTYQRLGRESLTDLVPLCRPCHRSVHEYLWANPGYHEKDTHAILRDTFGWTQQDMIARFEPYRLPGRPNGTYLTPATMTDHLSPSTN
jgi:hypothetical protein